MEEYDQFGEEAVARAEAEYIEYQGFLQSAAQDLEKCQEDIQVLESVLKSIPAMANIVRDAAKIQAMLQAKQERREQLRYTLGINPTTSA